jgi:DNA-directed RNA polymerase omega subunit
MKNCETKYELVIVASKRARKIVDQDHDLSITSRANPVSLALGDIAKGKLQWQ